MILTDLTAAASARAVLFGKHEKAVRAVTESIRSGGAADAISDALAELPEITRTAALSQLGAAATRLIEMDFTDILSVAWRKHEALRDAARRTVTDAGTEELVGLANHQVSLAHEPYIELLLDGRPVTTIRFQLSLDFEIAALVLVIRSGHITAVRAGTCKVSAKMAIEGAHVAGGTKNVDLPVIIRIGKGIPLLHGPQAPELLPPADGNPSADETASADVT